MSFYLLLLLNSCDSRRSSSGRDYCYSFCYLLLYYYIGHDDDDTQQHHIYDICTHDFEIAEHVQRRASHREPFAATPILDIDGYIDR